MTNDLAMNVEEDAELRELLISNLESRGVLSRIKVRGIDFFIKTRYVRVMLSSVFLKN